VKDFTALIILVDLDNILAPTAGVQFDKLEIKLFDKGDDKIK